MGLTSIIEKTEKAIVPDVEQPYKIPNNWQWVYFGSVCRVENGYAFKSKYFSDDRGTPVVRISDINNNIVCLDNAAKTLEESIDKRFIVHYGDLLIAMSGATTGKNGVYLSHQLAYFNQRVGNVKTIREDVVLPHYRNYFILQKTDEILNNAYGGAQPNISSKKICNLPFPLIPLNEQQRIVDRIESMFSKLDEAKEKAQAVLDGFEERKAAVLYRAFSGELTKEWRKNNCKTKEEWFSVPLSKVCDINPSKEKTKDLPDDLEVSFFPMPALSEIYGEITDPQTRKLVEVRTGFTNFMEGDVIFAKITPCMENGKSAVIGPLVNNIGYGSTEFFVLRCGAKLYNRYLWHIVRDQSFRNKAKAVMSGAVGQQRVPKNFLENYPLLLPSIEEQHEIVRIIDDLIDKEQQAKEKAEQIIDQIEIMKKSILARAFRGELGTNNPEDEPALELLKRVLSDDSLKEDNPKQTKKRITIPKEINSKLSTALERKIIKLYFELDTDELTLNDIFSVSSKKFDVLDSIRTLEKKQIIIKEDNGKYRLVG